MNTQEDNQISNMDATSVPPLSVGKTLCEAREQLGLSVNDVANRIKFAPRQIEALEADDYVRLPEAAFVRGFVRSYARLLGLDPTSLLSSLPSSHAQAASMHEVKSVEIALPSAFSARRHNIIWLAAALAIAVSLAIFERMHNRAPEQAETLAKTTVQALELPNGTAESPAEQVSAQESGQTQAAAPIAQQTVRAVPVPQQPVPQQAARPAPAQVVAKPEQPKIVRAAPAAVALPAAVPVPATPAAAPVAPPKAVHTAPVTQPWFPVPQRTERAAPAPAVTGAPAAAPEQPQLNGAITATEHALRIEFDEDAWVEVKDSSDKALVSRMHTAGSLVRVTGKAPLLVIIGNARAVRLFDNGKKINLERYTTAEVARVKLK